MRFTDTLTIVLCSCLATGLGLEARASWNCRPSLQGNGWDCGAGDEQTTSSASSGQQTTTKQTAPEAVQQHPADKLRYAEAAPASAEDSTTPSNTAPKTQISDAALASADDSPTEQADAKEASPSPATAPTPNNEDAAPSTTSTDASSLLENSPSDEATTSETAASSDALLRLHEGLSWSYCGAPPPGAEPLGLDSPPDDKAMIEIGADSVQLFRTEDRALLQGGVEISRGNQRLQAAEAEYLRETNIARARGDALLVQPGLRILGQEMEWSPLTRQGRVRDAHYRLEGMNARGSADSAHIESPLLSHYQNITYTTCPPQSDAWEIQADSLDVDRAEGVGTARHAKLRVAGVPVLYTPYLSFPLDDRRKSGFLIPAIGNSNKLGFNLSTPYYFNLAPTMDATLIPRYMSKRGFMLGGEFRYLTRKESGEFNGEIIPDDRRFDGDGVRGGFSFNQRGRFSRRWATDIKFDLVSDDSYLEDFGRELRVTSTRNLERRGDIVYYGKDWNLLGRVQGYQTVDASIADSSQPYQRLPQILFTLNKPRLWQGAGFRLEAENVYFNHDAKVHGNRLAFRPTVNLPMRRSYGHLIPKATLNHASYWLTDQTEGEPDTPSVTVPSFSLDGGLVFVRDIHWLDNAAKQTLEPRLYYLYTPYEDQSDLPVFDSAELDFSFSSLFRENRFTGRDRIADANQLTLALTSRTLSDDSGRELLRGSIGQVLYFADRRVQLAGSTDDESTSALAGELAARFNDHWQAQATLMWDPTRDEERTRKSSLGIHYRTPSQQLFNLSYRLNRSDLASTDTDYEDTDMSFLWPIDRNLKFVGRWLYSMRYDKTMEAVGGLQYSSCCWRVRALVRNFVDSPEDESELSFMLQVELSSLGAFGSDVEDFLQRSVYGYEVR